jgi:ribosomal protein S18 acetylase RimI-like enzyme
VHAEKPAAPLVRVRRPADDEFIVRLSLRAFGEYARDPGRTTLRMARAGATWILEGEQGALGFAVAIASADGSAELGAIALDESARGRGLGAELLGAVKRALAKARVRELTLHTALANLSALELFHKQGFVTERRLPRYYLNVFEACEMRKKLTLA